MTALCLQLLQSTMIAGKLLVHFSYRNFVTGIFAQKHALHSGVVVHGVYPPPNFLFTRVPTTKTMVREYTGYANNVITLRSYKSPSK